MQFFFLKNIFNEDDRFLIDFCVRGMAIANSTEVHSGQNDGAFGCFSEGLQRIFGKVYGSKAADQFYSRYDFDHSSGEEFFEWFDHIIEQDQLTIGHLLDEASIEV